MARRNRDLAGLAGLGALGMAMARLGKKGPGEDVPMPEDRGDMVITPAAAAAARDTSTGAASPAVSVRANRGPAVDEDGFPLNDEGQRFYLGAASAGRTAPAPGRPAATRQTPARDEAPAAAAPARAAASAASQAASAAKPASSPQAAPAASAAKSDSRGLTLGTPTRPAEGAPSIYAGPEAWAAYRQRKAAGMKRGGATKKMASGGSVSNASRRGDGIAQRGKTRGKIY